MSWLDAVLGITDASKAQSEAPVVSTQEETTAWDEVLSKYDVVSVEPNNGHPYVIVAEPSGDTGPKLLADTSMVDIHEIGTSSPSPFTSSTRKEYNHELAGLRGLEVFDKMRKSDGAVRGTLRLVKTPVLAARWFMEPKTDSTRDQNASDFVWRCLTDEMSISWSQVLVEALLMCDFGYYMFEKVWEERVIDGKTRMVLKKLAPRHPMDVKKWKYDANGGPSACVFYPPNLNGFEPDITIPIDKLLVFTFDREAGNIEGISVLRSAYKHWYYKEQLYKIDAIQKERHGIGIPIIKLPVGFGPEDKSIAENLGRNLRTNERAHVVLPPNWELIFAKLEGHVVDCLTSIDHHDAKIHENVLGGFLDSSSTTKEEDQVMFLKATRFIADVVCDTFNMYLIPDLMKYNYDKVGTPKLRARRIGESADWRTLSFAVRNLIGAKALTPDERLENYLRDEMDLPKLDKDTIREVATPQAPGTAAPGAASAAGAKQKGQKAGLPRQSTKPPVAPLAKNAGTDRSGG